MDEQQDMTELQSIARAIQDYRSDVNKRLDELDRKFDTIPAQLESIRRESRADNDALRRELTALFVPRSEYDPKHVVLIERVAKLETVNERQASQLVTLENALGTMSSISSTKFGEYDRLVSESRNSITQWYAMQNDVSNLKEKQAKLESRGASIGQKIYITVAVAASTVAIILNLFQHVSIHP